MKKLRIVKRKRGIWIMDGYLHIKTVPKKYQYILQEGDFIKTPKLKRLTSE